MLRFLLDLIASLILRGGWMMPEFVIRPRRFLYEPGLVMSTVFVGRQGVGKTFSMALELLERLIPTLWSAIPPWAGARSKACFQICFFWQMPLPMMVAMAGN